MNNQLQVFNNEIFGDVRVLEIGGRPWAVASDVARALGYKNTAKAIKDHCKGVTKRYTLTAGGEQEVNLIPESDIYRLVIKSKLPEAERFEKWVFDEVIPTIRKHGMYATDELLNDPDLAIKAFTALKEERERNRQLQAQNAVQEAALVEAKPKVIFADAVSASRTPILIGDLAKLLNQNGVSTGQKRLFDWLRSNGYLLTTGISRNMPSQRALDQELFRVKENTFTDNNDVVHITRTTLVTGKGQIYFINKFLGEQQSETE